MAANLKVITGANMFCDENPDESFHLELAEVGLPDFTRTMEEHMPAGGFMALNIDMNMLEPLKVPFKLVGVSESMLARVGYGDKFDHNYTIMKEVRDVSDNTTVRFQMTVKGRIGTASQEAYSKNGLSGFDYEIDGINSYTLKLGTVEIHDFDFFANRRSIRGVDQNSETNSILGIL